MISKQEVSNASAQPTLGLALGGGGARGLAHIGVLKVLEQAGLTIHHLTGSSMGAIIGAAYASGMSAAELETEMLRICKPSELVRLLDWRPRNRGLLNGTRIRNYFLDLFGSECTFANLKVPLTMTAVDLYSHEVVMLNEGCLADALRATMAVPGIFTPMEIDGRLLVDGGVLNLLPVDLLRPLNIDVVVAVDVGNWTAQSADEDDVDPSGANNGILRRLLPGPALDIWQALIIMMEQQVQQNLKEHPPDVIIQPALPADVGLFQGYLRVAELIALGEQAAACAVPQIRAAMAQDKVTTPESRSKSAPETLINHHDLDITDKVDEASWESFPASDPPSWNP